MASEIKVDTISEKTSAGGVTIDGLLIKDGGISGDVSLIGTTPTFTIGDAGAEDAALVFDGNAQDFYIALDDSADDLVIGKGSTVGTTPAVSIDENLQVIVHDNLSLLSDSSVLKFGTDGDTTLTHTDGTGLTLNSTNKLCFNDASQFIQGSSATVLSIGATDEIDLTATAVDLNGTLNVSGVATFQSTPVFPDGSLALADLDIDGGTDIGAAIVDADLFIVDDGAGGTNRKTAASRLKTYINSGGFVDCGEVAISNDTEVFLVHGTGGVTLDDTHEVYYMTLSGHDQSQTDGDDMAITFSHDAGSNYDVECHQAATQVEGDSDSGPNAATAIKFTNTGAPQTFADSVANGTNIECGFAEFWFYGFGDTSKHKAVFFRSTWWKANDKIAIRSGSMYIEETNNIDALRIAASSGTMRTGNIRLYGLKNN